MVGAKNKKSALEKLQECAALSSQQRQSLWQKIIDREPDLACLLQRLELNAVSAKMNKVRWHDS